MEQISICTRSGQTSNQTVLKHIRAATSIRTIWLRQGWQEPEIVESFNPDRTTLELPLAANKVAVKSGGKEGGIAEHRKADILQYLTDTPEAAG